MNIPSEGQQSHHCEIAYIVLSYLKLPLWRSGQYKKELRKQSCIRGCDGQYFVVFNSSI